MLPDSTLVVASGPAFLGILLAEVYSVGCIAEALSVEHVSSRQRLASGAAALGRCHNQPSALHCGISSSACSVLEICNKERCAASPIS